MRIAGIAETDTVIAYDRVGGLYAARLVWLLRVVGVEAAILDGGLAAWDSGLESGDVLRAHTTFTAREIPKELLADINEVASLAAKSSAGEPSGTVVLDARERSRYLGQPHPFDKVFGHIPGARSLPCRENLTQEGFLLPALALLERADAAGIQHTNTPFISTCGSGVTACHNLLVL